MSGNSAEDHMQHLMETFTTLRRCFSDEASAIETINYEIQLTNEWVGENTSEEPKRSPRQLGKVQASDKSQGGRSLFDDIDVDADAEATGPELA